MIISAPLPVLFPLLSIALPVVLLDPLLIFTAANRGHPVHVVQIPVNRGLQRFIKGMLRRPAQFLFYFGRINGVAAVMSRAVFYVANQLAARIGFFASQTLVRTVICRI